ncbi:hypothetical protein ANO11243_090090 [Dothideomycetidae sp. 11243]|nr:hypothetical protein ANO11243_090090 [fungal sp. No.11243]
MRGSCPEASVEMYQLRWKPFGQLADCVEIAEDPRDPTSKCRPYMVDGKLDAIADRPLSQPPVSSITIEQEDLWSAEGDFIDAHLEHADKDTPEAVWTRIPPGEHEEDHDSEDDSSDGDDGEGKILYVGNLYFDLTPERMQREFEQFGDVTNCKIVTDASGMSKGFGYIEFDNLESAAKAIEALNGQNLEGRRMAVQYHVRRMKTPSTQTRNPPSRTLFVGNMSFQMSDKDLHDLFRNVKNVLDVRVAIDRRSGQPRGFAHADFTDIESAQEAKKFLESKVVYGRQLRIDYGLPSALSKPRESRDSGESQ